MIVTSAQIPPSDAPHKTLQRLLPRLEQRFAPHLAPEEWEAFSRRLRSHFAELFAALIQLYGQQYDFFFHLESLLATVTEMWTQRHSDLKALDAMREVDPDWFRSNRMVGAMCYVDLFAGNLSGLIEKVPYLTELGITYLHLMPLFKVPEGDNDGGYAVSDYRQVDDRLGTMDQLSDLAQLLRHHGISLVLDFVLNHTSDEHEWAQRACAANKSTRTSIACSPIELCPTPTNAIYPPFFPTITPARLRIIAKSRNGFGRRFTTINGT